VYVKCILIPLGSFYNYSPLSFLRSLSYNTEMEDIDIDIDIEIYLDTDLIKVNETFKEV
jgi:hypothetical protein